MCVYAHAEAGLFAALYGSGYTFGQLLHKANLQPDFKQFTNAETPDAVINNFTRLQPTFTKLEIQVSIKNAKQIIRREKGVASRLLYSIKAELDNLESELRGTSVEPTSALLQTRTSKAELHGYNESIRRIFNNNIRMSASNPTLLRESMHLMRFTEHGAKVRADEDIALAEDYARKVEERHQRHQEQL